MDCRAHDRLVATEPATAACRLDCRRAPRESAQGVQHGGCPTAGATRAAFRGTQEAASEVGAIFNMSETARGSSLDTIWQYESRRIYREPPCAAVTRLIRLGESFRPTAGPIGMRTMCALKGCVSREGRQAKFIRTHEPGALSGLAPSLSLAVRVVVRTPRRPWRMASTVPNWKPSHPRATARKAGTIY